MFTFDSPLWAHSHISLTRSLNKIGKHLCVGFLIAQPSRFQIFPNFPFQLQIFPTFLCQLIAVSLTAAASLTKYFGQVSDIIDDLYRKVTDVLFRDRNFLGG